MKNVPTNHLGTGDQVTWQRYQRFLAELQASNPLTNATMDAVFARAQIAATLALAGAVDMLDNIGVRVEDRS